MNSGSYGLTPPGMESSSAPVSNSGMAGSSYPATSYPGYGFMGSSYAYPNYMNPGMTMMYQQQYGAYYNPYQQYGTYYNYGYPSYPSQQTTTQQSTTSSTNITSNISSAATTSKSTTNSIYATNSTQSSTTTVGGAYPNPFGSYSNTSFQKPSTVTQKKRTSRFDLSPEKSTTPSSHPSVLAKAESISKPIDSTPKPKGSNLNLSILQEAYQRKPFQQPQPPPQPPPPSFHKRSRSRSRSRSSDSEETSHRTRRSRETRRTKGSTSPPVEEDTPATLEKRRKRFQPIEPASAPNVSSASNASFYLSTEPASGKEFIGTMMTMEKEYFRLTCIPTPEMIRPKHILMKWLGILRSRMQNQEITYEYYSNQLRAIRQDLTVQHIHDEFTLQVYEEHARFALEHNDMNEFNRCQTQLKELYAHNFANAHVEEFTCYQLLYCVFSQQAVDLNPCLRSLSAQELHSPKVRKVLQICLAIRREDYHSFFQAYAQETLPFQCKHFMKLFFRRMRSFALYSIVATIKPSVSLELLKKMLYFESYQEAIEGLKEFGIVFQKKAGMITDEEARSMVMSVNDVVAAMRNHQPSEKGTKLL